MATKRKSYELLILRLSEAQVIGNEVVLDLRELPEDSQSGLVPVSENRHFRKFCKQERREEVVAKNRAGRPLISVDGEPVTVVREVKLAREFSVWDCNPNIPPYVSDRDRKKLINIFKHKLEAALQNGVRVIYSDDEEYVYKRVLRSASQVRGLKVVATSENVKRVRKLISYDANFGEVTNVAKAEARIGSSGSSTLSVGKQLTFDILPDPSIKRKHDMIRVGREIQHIEGETEKYEPLDGQGTVRPRKALDWALAVGVINQSEHAYAKVVLEEESEDLELILDSLDDVRFLRIWRKVPQAWQVRYGLVKGLLVVHPHHLAKYRQDCNNSKYRLAGDVMNFWKEAKDTTQIDVDGEKVTAHEYNFDADVLFTDSMWKGNISPYYTDAYAVKSKKSKNHVPTEDLANVEVVLYAKEPKKHDVFMGYQFWQSLQGLDVKKFAKRALRTIEKDVFLNPVSALKFLGAVDSEGAEDTIESDLLEMATKVSKISLLLMKKPAMIGDKYVQATLHELVETFILNIRDRGRIPVEGRNPYIISPPEMMFGLEPQLSKGQAYYNNEEREVALFRSPNMVANEVVYTKLVKVEEYRNLYRNLLVLNPFNDYLPRMGGADTDGDKVAMVWDKHIVAHVKKYNAKLPMVVNTGENAKKEAYDDKAVMKYDMATILPEAFGEKFYTVGEITNFSTTWKDLIDDKVMLEEAGMSIEFATEMVYELAGKQGLAIDFAKTGFNVPPSKESRILIKPAWRAKVRKDVYDENNNIKYYYSESAMQQNFDFVDDYLKNDFKDLERLINVNFSTEFRAAVNLEEFLQVIEPMTEIESQYRREVYDLMKLVKDEDERRESIGLVLDNYRQIVDALPYPMEVIAAAAYDVSYNASSSNGNAVTFPWNVAFDGLLALCENSSDKSLRLRRLDVACDASDVPDQLKVYRKQFMFTLDNGIEIKGQISAPNGTYPVYKSEGKAYIRLTSKKIINHLRKSYKQRVTELQERVIPAQINGFNYYDMDAKGVVEALQETDGVVTLKYNDRTDGKTKVISVVAGDTVIGNISARFAHEFAVYMDGGKSSIPFHIPHVSRLSATYTKEDGEEAMHKFFNVNLTIAAAVNLASFESFEEELEKELVHFIDEDEMDARYGDYYDAGYDYPVDYPRYDEDSSYSIVVDEEDEEMEDELEEALGMINYEEILAVAPKKYSDDMSDLYSRLDGFHASIEDNLIELNIYRSNGNSTVVMDVYVIVMGNGQMKFRDNEKVAYCGDEKRTVNAEFEKLIMQLAKFAKANA